MPVIARLGRQELAEIVHALTSIKTRLDSIEKKVDQIMAIEKDELDALDTIDQATTKIGDVVNAIAATNAQISTTVTTIGTEVAALVASQQSAGVSQAIIDKTKAIGARLDALSASSQAASDSASGLVPVLQAIASQGAAQPVPVPVPPVTAG
jgi:NCAIR mutase (PurE)-related protein